MLFSFENIKNSLPIALSFVDSPRLNSLCNTEGFFKMKQLQLDLEVWKDVKGYEWLYQISTFARVKSLERRIKNGDTSYMILKERILKASIDSKGYWSVNLSKEGKARAYRVHRLMAEAFIPNPKNLPMVDHRNGFRHDNRLDNFRWFTNRQNVSQGYLAIKTTSQYTGVCWLTKAKRWMASIYFENKQIGLGWFKTELEAHHAYQRALKEINEGTFVTVPKRTETSKYLGVWWFERNKRWSYTIRHEGKQIVSCRFHTELEAYEARQVKLKELFP